MNQGEISKIYGTSKILRHPAKLQSFVKDKVEAPVYVRFKPTNICNHHCYYCAYDSNSPSGVDRTLQLSREKVMETIDNFKEMGVRAVTFSGGGEPLIFPHIAEAMKKILDYSIDLSIITNGQSLNGEKAKLLAKAKWVRISLDSSDAKIFSETRGVPETWFDELVENIKN